jgi:hypothetical protein
VIRIPNADPDPEHLERAKKDRKKRSQKIIRHKNITIEMQNGKFIKIMV